MAVVAATAPAVLVKEGEPLADEPLITKGLLAAPELDAEELAGLLVLTTAPD